MKTIKFLLLASSAIVFLACEKKRPDKLEGDKAQLIGTWVWDSTLHSVGCQFGTEEYTYTPSTEERQYSLLFEASGHLTFLEKNQSTDQFFLIFSNFSFHDVPNRWQFTFLLDNEEDRKEGGYIFEDLLMIGFFPYEDSEDGCHTYQNFFHRE